MSWDARRGNSYFEYNHKFLTEGLNPFPLLASVDSPTSKRPIMGDKETKLYRKLPPFLADSLPDAWGNQVLNEQRDFFGYFFTYFIRFLTYNTYICV